MRFLTLAEKSFYKDKARITWLEEGDANTTFFQSKYKVQSVRNRILSIKDRNRIMLTNYEKVKEEVVVGFYRDLFADHSITQINYEEELGHIIKKRIVLEDGDALQGMVTNNEIGRALINMKKGKAPGPDGFSVDFFKHSWNVVKENVFEAAKTFFATCHMPKALNNTNVC
ncbi:hypothetical protein LIER_10717 [Lithospermum erythrorhizon]|uniref:Uncharacterized protein n=1 Tax=Lithospermum erythrorhizon TaxID=34254 RepID=A0AAV3PKG6_LITER